MEKETNDCALKNDFLAAYHSVLFSRTSDDDADVERRRLAIKYMTARKFECEDTAAILLGQGLKQYERLLKRTESTKGLNCPDNKDTTKWRSSLKNVHQALSWLKPLPCQKNSSDRICGRKDLVDRDVENLMKISEQNVVPTNRKVPNAHTNRIILQPYSKMEQDRFSYSRYDRSDNPRRTSTKNEWERMNGESTKKYETSGDFRQENNSSDRSQYKNQWKTMEDDDNKDKYDQSSKPGPFRTAKTELHIQQQKANKKSLGGKASVNSKFVCPFKRDKESEEDKIKNMPKETSEVEDERLKGIDEKLIELVRNEIMDNGSWVSWDDVAGLEHAKKIIKEIVVLPMLRPDIFTGLRRPPKGILLFGPPGTGKTLIGKCIASQSKSTFFSISASSLTSKWIGEGEKMVRALFAVARVHQPSVIFIDEIDSLLTQRSETEHESSRRIKTEFLVQLDGAATGEADRILVIGATNRPQELDEAARRRFVKRLYVPLPEFEARRQIIENLLAAEHHELTSNEIDNIAHLSEHFSGADMTSLCKEASMGPIRSIPFDMLENIRKEDVRCVTAGDFKDALSYVRPSVSQSDLGLYINWDRTYGSGTVSINKNSN